MEISKALGVSSVLFLSIRTGVWVSSPGRLFLVDVLAISGTSVVRWGLDQTFIGFLSMKEHNCLCKFGPGWLLLFFSPWWPGQILGSLNICSWCLLLYFWPCLISPFTYPSLSYNWRFMFYIYNDAWKLSCASHSDLTANVGLCQKVSEIWLFLEGVQSKRSISLPFRLWLHRKALQLRWVWVRGRVSQSW